MLVTSVRPKTFKLQSPMKSNSPIFCDETFFFSFQFVPLKAWLYREGFARFSNTPYSLSTIDDKCILSLEQP